MWPLTFPQKIVLGALVAVSLLFLMWPELDLAVMRALYLGDNMFLLRGTWIDHFYDQVRTWMTIAFELFLVVVTFAGLLDWPIFELDNRRLAYLWSTGIIAVGLLVNLFFKVGFGRARPKHVEEFGGTLLFSPAWVPVDHCTSNCSFVSGDASMAFMAVTFALLAPRERRPAALTAAVLFGLAASSMRVLTGSHFPSDVLIAALVTVLTAMIMHEAIIVRRISLPRLPVPQIPLPSTVHRDWIVVGRQPLKLRFLLKLDSLQRKPDQLPAVPSD